MTDWSTPRVSPVPLRPREVSLRERALDRTSPLRRLDWILLLAVAALLRSAGCWSGRRPSQHQIAAASTPARSSRSTCSTSRSASVLGTIAALVDYRTLRAYTPVVYLASLLGLLAVLVPARLDHQRRALLDRARRRLRDPAVGVRQARAHRSAWRCCSRERRDGERPRRADTRRPAVARGRRRARSLLILHAARPRLGHGARRSSSSACSRVCRRVRAAGSSACSARRARRRVVVGQPALLKQYQIDRFAGVRQPARATPRASATTSTRRASPSAPAACSGKGLFHGAQTQRPFVPEQQTDFVFTVAGEELGFVGAGVHHPAVRRGAVARPARSRAGRRTRRHAGRRRASSAGSASRPSRTSA